MDSEALRKSLEKLQAELGRAPRVDAESRELLRRLSADIDRLVDQPPSQPAATSHRSSLEELEVRFEVEHPALAQTVRELIDALGKAGL
ncbi:MAG: DUF4404 family protein [Steroidobacterales bacterium]